jgi:general stress protein YciG
MSDISTPKQKRGFAAMDPERHRAIAQKGGRAVAAKGTGHHFTSETARAAALKSSENRHRFTSETAREAGQKGGKASRTKKDAEVPSTEV